MSFLPINEQNQQAPQGQTTNAPTSQGNVPTQTGGSAGAGQGGGAAKGTSTGTPTQFGSSASKLGDYLSANAPQIQNQANQVTNNLNQQYGQVGTDIGAAANQFGQQVSQGYAAPNQDVVNQALANPTQFVSNPNNVSAFQAQYNDTYKGPQNFESTTPYSNIQNEVNTAVQNAGLLNTQAGLQNYFSQGAGPNQTKASNTLDTLLLTGNPQAQQQIQQAAGQFQSLTPQFQNTVTAADQGVTAAQQAAQQAQQYAQGQANPYAQNFNTGLQNAVTTNETGRNAYNQSLAGNQAAATTGRTNLFNTQNQNLQKLLSGYGWLTSLGAGSNSPQMQSGETNLGKALAPNTSAYDAILAEQMNNNPATLANTSTADQYAQANALSQLLGTNYNNPLNQADISQAGTYKPQGPGLSLTNAQNAEKGQTQYMNDLLAAGLVGPQAFGSQANSDPMALIGQFEQQGMTPQQAAQNVLNGTYSQSEATPEQLAALQQLAANQYAV